MSCLLKTKFNLTDNCIHLIHKLFGARDSQISTPEMLTKETKITPTETIR